MPSKIRSIQFLRSFTRYAEGSVLVCMGNTKVLCTASVSEDVPGFLKGKGKGWVTSEYSMLPRSTAERTSRDSVKGKINGRSHEIQRLIGRSLRAVVNMEALGERQIVLDCDVLQADGGTRTASINGAYVALADALHKLKSQGKLIGNPLREAVAAVSVGLINGQPRLDLCYEEDSSADVDLNVVMTASGKFVEIQGTAEREPFSKAQLDQLLNLAKKGIDQVLIAQKMSLRR